VEGLNIPENEYTIQETSDANQSRTRQLYDPSVDLKKDSPMVFPTAG
jgi:hypothetical protein